MQLQLQLQSTAWMRLTWQWIFLGFDGYSPRLGFTKKIFREIWVEVSWMFMTLPNGSEIQSITCIKIMRNAMERTKESKLELMVQTVWVYWLNAPSEDDKEGKTDY